MRVLVVGSGGREHALVKAIKKSPRVKEVLVAPGNPGMQGEARRYPIAAEDIPRLIQCAQEEKVDLTIVGPELPLTLGIVDAFQKAGLRIFGPSQAAARLEASKIFTKNFLKKYRIPTAQYEIFDRIEAAQDFIKKNAERRWVVKVDGLAAGKGVYVTRDASDALQALDEIFIKKTFGEQKVVIEEFLEGEEVSFMVLCSGIEGLALASSQDHKRLCDGDQGPNTGGMGAYSPAPIMDAALSEEVMRTIIAPTLAGMREEGSPFKGVLYAGLMICEGKPMVLEYNVRFGDPEAEALLPRLTSDWVDLFEAAIDGRLTEANPQWSPQSAVCVVLAAQGYPFNPQKGDMISGLKEAGRDAIVCHAGTVEREGKFFTNGGRVLTVTALDETLSRAVDRVYRAVAEIHFSGMQYRKDIGARGLLKK